HRSYRKRRRGEALHSRARPSGGRGALELEDAPPEKSYQDQGDGGRDNLLPAGMSSGSGFLSFGRRDFGRGVGTLEFVAAHGTLRRIRLDGGSAPRALVHVDGLRRRLSPFR